MFVYLLFIYKKPIILSLFKIDTLNFTVYILTILTCSLKTYVIRLRNIISMNIFFTIKIIVFFIIVKKKPKTDRLRNLLKPQTSLNPISINIFFTIKGDSFPL